MLYEIINPSDCVTFEADELKIAACTTWLLSTGYGATCLEGEGEDIPIGFFGNDLAWWAEHSPTETITEFLDANSANLATALESCLCMGASERKTFKAAADRMTPEEYEKFKAEVNDRNRTSLNNICAKAGRLAAALRANQLKIKV